MVQSQSVRNKLKEKSLATCRCSYNKAQFSRVVNIGLTAAYFIILHPYVLSSSHKSTIIHENKLPIPKVN